MAYNHDIQKIEYKDEWATYRYDSSRSGNTHVSISTNFQKKWNTKLKGKLTAPVIGDDKVFLASINLHTIFALDAKNGKVLWKYTAGGRIDSPPTIYKGRVFFGSNDGWVYCLKSLDGKLIWKYCAAPAQRVCSSYGQIESLWPIHGSVLIEKDNLYCVAGRTRFLDEGIRVLKLNPITGEKLLETVMDRTVYDFEVGKYQKIDEELTTNYMSGLSARAAILQTYQGNIFMTRQAFDLDINPIKLKGPDAEHLTAPEGFLEDNWMHRTTWFYGIDPKFSFMYVSQGLHEPAGKIMVFDADNVYAFGRKRAYRRWTTPVRYQIFSAQKKTNRYDKNTAGFPGPKGVELFMKLEKEGKPIITKVNYNWQESSPQLHAWAMVLADKNLIVAGTPRFMDELKIWKNLKDPKVKEKMKQQETAWEGKKGGILQIYSKDNGEMLKEYKLDNAPIWDGMAIAKGAIYITCRDGSVICLK